MPTAIGAGAGSSKSLMISGLDELFDSMSFIQIKVLGKKLDITQNPRKQLNR